MLRFATRLSAVVLCATVVVAMIVSPAAAAAGVTVQITELARQFAAGSTTMTVVASKASGTDCLKVRWSLLIQVQGVRLDQIRIGRFEETGSFPVETRVDGNAARLTDIDPDPGTLCLDRTVTAQYQVIFNPDVTAGVIQLTAEAYDVDLRLLERASATRTVLGQPPAGTAASATAQPSAEPSTTLEPTVVATGSALPRRTAGPVVAGAVPGNDPFRSTSGRPGLLAVGIAVGGLLFLFGFGILLKLIFPRSGRQSSPFAQRRPWYAFASGRRHRSAGWPAPPWGRT